MVPLASNFSDHFERNFLAGNVVPREVDLSTRTLAKKLEQLEIPDIHDTRLGKSDVGDERAGVEHISEGVQGEAEMIEESSKTGVLGSRGVRGIATRSLTASKGSRTGGATKTGLCVEPIMS